MEYTKENKIVSISLIIFLISLLLVYVFFFNIENNKKITDDTIDRLQSGDSLDQNIAKNTWNTDTKSNSWNDDILSDIDILLWNNYWPNFGSWYSSGQDTSWYLSQTWDIVPNIDNEIIDMPTFNSESSNPSDGEINDIIESMPNLTWSSVFFGDTEATKTLVIEPEYILKDSTWILYLYMGKSWLDYEQMTKLLWWDIYEINTELDIQKNWLIWDWVKYINIPNITYTSKPTIKRKLVFMVISYKSDQRLIELEYDRYHKLKKHIKEIFEQSYD